MSVYVARNQDGAISIYVGSKPTWTEDPCGSHWKPAIGTKVYPISTEVWRTVREGECAMLVLERGAKVRKPKPKPVREPIIPKTETGKRLLRILRHAVGADKTPRERWGYRNRFSATTDSEAFRDCIMLVSLGLMTRSFTAAQGKDEAVFRATAQGCFAAGLLIDEIERAMS